MKVMNRLIGNHHKKPPIEIENIKLRGFRKEIEVFVNRLDTKVINEKIFILEVKTLVNKYRLEDNNEY